MELSKKPISKKWSTIIGVTTLLLLLVMAIVFVLVLQSTPSETTPIITTRIRAAGSTYRRTFVIQKKLSITSPTPTAIAEDLFSQGENSTSSGTFDESGVNIDTLATPSGDLSPTSGFDFAATPSSTLTVTQTASPTITFDAEAASSTAQPTISSLPKSGSIQYPVMIFIAASAVLFISFLF